MIDQKRAEAETQLKLVAFLINDLKAKEGKYEIIPGSLGFTDGTLQTAVEIYNQMVFERDGLLEAANKDHPKVKSLTENLNVARTNILEAADVAKHGLQIQLNGDVYKRQELLKTRDTGYLTSLTTRCFCGTRFSRLAFGTQLGMLHKELCHLSTKSLQVVSHLIDSLQYPFCLFIVLHTFSDLSNSLLYCTKVHIIFRIPEFPPPPTISS